MKINFHSIELTIQDNELGCTVIFSDSKSAGEQFKTEDELINSIDKYFLIQRSYPEFENENDWYTVESSETEIDFSQKDKIYVTLRQKEIEIYCAGVTHIISQNLSDKEHSQLDKVLRARFKDEVEMIGE
jgi:hypothetical protein